MLRIRPFNPNDVPAISLIVRESLHENYPTTLYFDVYKWWREGFLVAEKEARIIGFVAGVISAPQQARILMLAVIESERAKGVGRALMDSFIREAKLRGIRRIELEVRVSNIGAIKFYRRYGFTIVNTIKAFYTDGEDGYKMMRQI